MLLSVTGMNARVMSRLTRHLLNIGTREPTLLTLLDEGTIPPSTHRVFSGMSLDHYIFDE